MNEANSFTCEGAGLCREKKMCVMIKSNGLKERGILNLKSARCSGQVIKFLCALDFSLAGSYFIELLRALDVKCEKQ